MSDKLDVIIFGASGFTGKYTVYEAVTVLQNLRWGIAGRSRPKLEQILKDMGLKANKNLSSIPIILADIDDDTSLLNMAKRCKVLVNCCGPYRFYGEPVVKACIEAGTHQVDVSGEPQYMETMQLKYNKIAKEKGVYLVSACGFDSIPCDMGTVFIEKNFDGVVNSVESYLQVSNKTEKVGGAGINYGTWESAVYALAHSSELRQLRSQLYPERMPKLEPVLKRRPIVFFSNIVNGICMPFPGSDRSVVMRSQRFMYEHEKKRPVQMYTYMAFNSWINALVVALTAVVFGIMTKFAQGRRLLLKYPRLFSMGFISHEGPREELMEGTHFSLTMKAQGWSQAEQLLEPSDKHTNSPSKSLMVKISGTNPAYGATCVSLLCTALIILKESDKMPDTGGVLPPAAAFAKTSLIAELEKYEHGLKFEIMANK